MTPPCYPHSRGLWLLKAAAGVSPGAAYWWERYCSQAQDPDHLYLLSGVYQQLEREDASNDQLQRVYLAVWTRSLQQIRLAEQAITALREGGLEPILLKGLAVSSLLAWNGHRAMDDFDVLIRPDELERAAEQLERSGWVAQAPLPSAERRQIVHGMAWHRQGHSLDLHWFIMPESLDFGLDEEWRARAHPVQLGGQACPALEPTHLLLHTLVHGCKSGARYGWVPDSCGLIRQSELDWHRLLQDVVRRRVVLQCRAGLEFLAREMEAPVPAWVLEELQRLPAGRLEHLYFRVKTGRRRLWCFLLWPLLDYVRLPERSGFLTYLALRWDCRGPLWREALKRLGYYWAT